VVVAGTEGDSAGAPVPRPSSSRGVRGSDLPLFTLAEVTEHKTSGSAWVVYEQEVYDVTGYAERHPGGAALLEDRLGSDISADFEAFFHGRHARELLRAMRIGRLKGGATRSLLAPPGGVPGGGKRLVPSGAKAALLGPGPSRGGAGPPGGLGVPSQFTSTVPISLPAPGSPADADGPRIPRTAMSLRIASRRELKGDVWLICLEGRLPWTVEPGQHIMLWAEVGGAVRRRPYTPISASVAGLELLVRRYEGGTMSEHLCGNASEASVSGPLGASLGRSIGRLKAGPVLLFAGGTGITAFLRLSELPALAKSRPLLVWSERCASVEVLQLLSLLQRSLPGLVVGVFSQSPPPEVPGLRLEQSLTACGKLDAASTVSAIRTAQGVSDAEAEGAGAAVVCGPPAYNAAVAAMLQAGQFAGTVFRLE